MCCTFPFLSYKGYFISMLNRCASGCAFSLRCWDDYRCVKNWLVESTCDSLLSSYSTSIWWRRKFTITSCWSSLLGASISWIPSAWKCGYSYNWIASWIGCCGAPNFNCLLKPFMTSFNIFYYFKTIFNLNFFRSTCCFIN